VAEPTEASQSWRYPILTRDNDTLGYFKINSEANNYARITLENLPSWMFSAGTGYNVIMYDGPLYTDVYSELQQLGNNPQTWTTFPVKHYDSGKTLTVNELVQQTGLSLKIIAPSEVIGIGTIQ
jgi:hypothetical protein